MAPGRPVRSIKIRVPRHNAQKIGAKLSGEVQQQARRQAIRADTYQPNGESSSALAHAIESASEWNSMLITARAERGPQWDVGTQLFHIDQYSDLYYDSTPLFDAIKQQGEVENAEERKQQQQAQEQHAQAQQAHRERELERARERELQLQNVQQMALLDQPPSPPRQYATPGYPAYAASPAVPQTMSPMRVPYGGGAPFNPGPGPGYYNNAMGQSPARISMGGMDPRMSMRNGRWNGRNQHGGLWAYGHATRNADESRTHGRRWHDGASQSSETSNEEQRYFRRRCVQPRAGPVVLFCCISMHAPQSCRRAPVHRPPTHPNTQQVIRCVVPVRFRAPSAPLSLLSLRATPNTSASHPPSSSPFSPLHARW
ncbi:hypothetical protein C8F01DRAFT_1341180 [Mycena amicta]|nr:hypothetical protein C8F01DRAFT_1341180 [Mycena amicta]